MKCLKRYKDINKRRQYKNRDRARNYKTGRLYQTTRRAWYPRDEAILYIRDQEGIKTDREIARELNRSVQGIQSHRHYLLNKPIPANIQSIIDWFRINGIPVDTNENQIIK